MAYDSSQACNWYYFSLLEGENPPVYFIREGQEIQEPVDTYESLLAFVRKMGR